MRFARRLFWSTSLATKGTSDWLSPCHADPASVATGEELLHQHDQASSPHSLNSSQFSVHVIMTAFQTLPASPAFSLLAPMRLAIDDAGQLGMQASEGVLAHRGCRCAVAMFCSLATTTQETRGDARVLVKNLHTPCNDRTQVPVVGLHHDSALLSPAPICYSCVDGLCSKG